VAEPRVQIDRNTLENILHLERAASGVNGSSATDGIRALNGIYEQYPLLMREAERMIPYEVGFNDAARDTKTPLGAYFWKSFNRQLETIAFQGAKMAAAIGDSFAGEFVSNMENAGIREPGDLYRQEKYQDISNPRTTLEYLYSGGGAMLADLPLFLALSAGSGGVLSGVGLGMRGAAVAKLFSRGKDISRFGGFMQRLTSSALRDSSTFMIHHSIMSGHPDPKAIRSGMMFGVGGELGRTLGMTMAMNMKPSAGAIVAGVAGSVAAGLSFATDSYIHQQDAAEDYWKTLPFERRPAKMETDWNDIAASFILGAGFHSLHAAKDFKNLKYWLETTKPIRDAKRDFDKFLRGIESGKVGWDEMLGLKADPKGTGREQPLPDADITPEMIAGGFFRGAAFGESRATGLPKKLSGTDWRKRIDLAIRKLSPILDGRDKVQIREELIESFDRLYSKDTTIDKENYESAVLQAAGRNIEAFVENLGTETLFGYYKATKHLREMLDKKGVNKKALARIDQLHGEGATAVDVLDAYLIASHLLSNQTDFAELLARRANLSNRKKKTFNFRDQKIESMEDAQSIEQHIVEKMGQARENNDQNAIRENQRALSELQGIMEQMESERIVEPGGVVERGTEPRVSESRQGGRSESGISELSEPHGVSPREMSGFKAHVAREAEVIRETGYKAEEPARPEAADTRKGPRQEGEIIEGRGGPREQAIVEEGGPQPIGDAAVAESRTKASDLKIVTTKTGQKQYRYKGRIVSKDRYMELSRKVSGERKGELGTTKMPPGELPTEPVVRGDLMDIFGTAVVHGQGVVVVPINQGHVHGAGLAKMFKDYMANPHVMPIYVKKHWRDEANIDLMKDGLRRLINRARSEPDVQFYLPLMGLGHGQGDPKVILPLLKQTMEASPNIHIVIPTREALLKTPKGTTRTDKTPELLAQIEEFFGIKEGLPDEAGIVREQPEGKVVSEEGIIREEGAIREQDGPDPIGDAIVEEGIPKKVSELSTDEVRRVAESLVEVERKRGVQTEYEDAVERILTAAKEEQTRQGVSELPGEEAQKKVFGGVVYERNNNVATDENFILSRIRSVDDIINIMNRTQNPELGFQIADQHLIMMAKELSPDQWIMAIMSSVYGVDPRALKAGEIRDYIESKNGRLREDLKREFVLGHDTHTALRAIYNNLRSAVERDITDVYSADGQLKLRPTENVDGSGKKLPDYYKRTVLDDLVDDGKIGGVVYLNFLGRHEKTEDGRMIFNPHDQAGSFDKLDTSEKIMMVDAALERAGLVMHWPFEVSPTMVGLRPRKAVTDLPVQKLYEQVLRELWPGQQEARWQGQKPINDAKEWLDARLTGKTEKSQHAELVKIKTRMEAAEAELGPGGKFKGLDVASKRGKAIIRDAVSLEGHEHFKKNPIEVRVIDDNQIDAITQLLTGLDPDNVRVDSHGWAPSAWIDEVSFSTGAPLDAKAAKLEFFGRPMNVGDIRDAKLPGFTETELRTRYRKSTGMLDVDGRGNPLPIEQVARVLENHPVMLKTVITAFPDLNMYGARGEAAKQRMREIAPDLFDAEGNFTAREQIIVARSAQKIGSLDKIRFRPRDVKRVAVQTGSEAVGRLGFQAMNFAPGRIGKHYVDDLLGPAVDHHVDLMIDLATANPKEFANELNILLRDSEARGVGAFMTSYNDLNRLLSNGVPIQSPAVSLLAMPYVVRRAYVNGILKAAMPGAQRSTIVPDVFGLVEPGEAYVPYNVLKKFYADPANKQRAFDVRVLDDVFHDNGAMHQQLVAGKGVDLAAAGIELHMAVSRFPTRGKDGLFSVRVAGVLPEGRGNVLMLNSRQVKNRLDADYDADTAHYSLGVDPKSPTLEYFNKPSTPVSITDGKGRLQVPVFNNDHSLLRDRNGNVVYELVDEPSSGVSPGFVNRKQGFIETIRGQARRMLFDGDAIAQTASEYHYGQKAVGQIVSLMAQRRVIADNRLQPKIKIGELETRVRARDNKDMDELAAYMTSIATDNAKHRAMSRLGYDPLLFEMSLFEAQTKAGKWRPLTAIPEIQKTPKVWAGIQKQIGNRLEFFNFVTRITGQGPERAAADFLSWYYSPDSAEIRGMIGVDIAKQPTSPTLLKRKKGEPEQFLLPAGIRNSGALKNAGRANGIELSHALNLMGGIVERLEVLGRGGMSARERLILKMRETGLLAEPMVRTVERGSGKNRRRFAEVEIASPLMFSRNAAFETHKKAREALFRENRQIMNSWFRRRRFKPEGWSLKNFNSWQSGLVKRHEGSQRLFRFTEEGQARWERLFGNKHWKILEDVHDLMRDHEVAEAKGFKTRWDSYVDTDPNTGKSRIVNGVSRNVQDMMQVVSSDPATGRFERMMADMLFLYDDTFPAAALTDAIQNRYGEKFNQHYLPEAQGQLVTQAKYSEDFGSLLHFLGRGNRKQILEILRQRQMEDGIAAAREKLNRYGKMRRGSVNFGVLFDAAKTIFGGQPDHVTAHGSVAAKSPHRDSIRKDLNEIFDVGQDVVPLFVGENRRADTQLDALRSDVRKFLGHPDIGDGEAWLYYVAQDKIDAWSMDLPRPITEQEVLRLRQKWNDKTSRMTEDRPASPLMAKLQFMDTIFGMEVEALKFFDGINTAHGREAEFLARSGMKLQQFRKLFSRLEQEDPEAGVFFAKTLEGRGLWSWSHDLAGKLQNRNPDTVPVDQRPMRLMDFQDLLMIGLRDEPAYSVIREKYDSRPGLMLPDKPLLIESEVNTWKKRYKAAKGEAAKYRVRESLTKALEEKWDTQVFALRPEMYAAVRMIQGGKDLKDALVGIPEVKNPELWVSHEGALRGKHAGFLQDFLREGKDSNGNRRMEGYLIESAEASLRNEHHHQRRYFEVARNANKQGSEEWAYWNALMQADIKKYNGAVSKLRAGGTVFYGSIKGLGFGHRRRYYPMGKWDIARAQAGVEGARRGGQISASMLRRTDADGYDVRVIGRDSVDPVKDIAGYFEMNHRVWRHNIFAKEFGGFYSEVAAELSKLRGAGVGTHRANRLTYLVERAKMLEDHITRPHDSNIELIAQIFGNVQFTTKLGAINIASPIRNIVGGMSMYGVDQGIKAMYTGLREMQTAEGRVIRNRIDMFSTQAASAEQIAGGFDRPVMLSESQRRMNDLLWDHVGGDRGGVGSDSYKRWDNKLLNWTAEKTRRASEVLGKGFTWSEKQTRAIALGSYRRVYNQAYLNLRRRFGNSNPEFLHVEADRMAQRATMRTNQLVQGEYRSFFTNDVLRSPMGPILFAFQKYHATQLRLLTRYHKELASDVSKIGIRGSLPGQRYSGAKIIKGIVDGRDPASRLFRFYLSHGMVAGAAILLGAESMIRLMPNPEFQTAFDIATYMLEDERDREERGAFGRGPMSTEEGIGYLVAGSFGGPGLQTALDILLTLSNGEYSRLAFNSANNMFGGSYARTWMDENEEPHLSGILPDLYQVGSANMSLGRAALRWAGVNQSEWQMRGNWEQLEDLKDRMEDLIGR